MLRPPLAKPYLQRPLKVLYGWSQATPKGMFLDPAWDRSVPIWPGMVAMKTQGDNVTLINSTGVPAGLFGNFIGGDGVDELLDANINACAVWVMDPDAEFIVQDPAFDSSLSWVDPANGTAALVYASVTGANRGKLIPAGALGVAPTGGTTRPVARLIRIDSTKQIVIGGLYPGDAAAAGS